ncbi:MAG: hypothetical protein A2136_05750 [Chloroflexi bacterium RBG_16_54_11]|nr:MAG: hypothetical protein A2136_05750 [Chloroflexi bacterium RBG_16_54_11]
MVEGLNLHLETLFVIDVAGRIISTREPQAYPGPKFIIIRSKDECIWSIRVDISKVIAEELSRLASEEPPLSGLFDPPKHAARYKSFLRGQIHSGPSFTFPHLISQPSEVVLVEDEHLLNYHFSGWIPGEIGAGRAPVLAVFDGGAPISVCFSARRSQLAAEAGVETALGFRGRGLASRVTAAWALAIRAWGMVPFYSTDWSNTPSLSLARKLGLELFTIDWSISD